MDAFERLHLRKVLAKSFQALRVEGEDSWRLAARVRLLLTLNGQMRENDAEHESKQSALPPQTPGALETLAAGMETDPDLRWLTDVHTFEGITYFAKEPFEQLLWWQQLPVLLTPDASFAKIQQEVDLGCKAAALAGYDLDVLKKNIVAPALPAIASLPLNKSAAPSSKPPQKTEPQQIKADTAALKNGNKPAEKTKTAPAKDPAKDPTTAKKVKSTPVKDAPRRKPKK